MRSFTNPECGEHVRDRVNLNAHARAEDRAIPRESSPPSLSLTLSASFALRCSFSLFSAFHAVPRILAYACSHLLSARRRKRYPAAIGASSASNSRRREDRARLLHARPDPRRVPLPLAAAPSMPRPLGARRRRSRDGDSPCVSALRGNLQQ